MRTTLLLDAHFQPLGVIDWQKAILLLIQEKAEVIKASDKLVRTVSKEFVIPSILRLLRRSYQKYRSTFSRRGVYLRDQGICGYCLKYLSYNASTIDHIIPVSRGGNNTWQNAALACKECNNKKGAKTPEEAGMKLHHQARIPSRMELIIQAINDSPMKLIFKDFNG